MTGKGNIFWVQFGLKTRAFLVWRVKSMILFYVVLAMARCMYVMKNKNEHLNPDE